MVEAKSRLPHDRRTAFRYGRGSAISMRYEAGTEGVAVAQEGHRYVQTRPDLRAAGPISASPTVSVRMRDHQARTSARAPETAYRLS